MLGGKEDKDVPKTDVVGRPLIDDKLAFGPVNEKGEEELWEDIEDIDIEEEDLDPVVNLETE